MGVQIIDKLSKRLFSSQLRHTKPGAVGRTYPTFNIATNEDVQEDENSDQRQMLPSLTVEQMEKKRQSYEEHIEEILERDKIPDDELKKLINVNGKIDWLLYPAMPKKIIAIFNSYIKSFFY